MGIPFFFKRFKKVFPQVVRSDFEKQHDILILEINGMIYKNIKEYYCKTVVENHTFDYCQMYQTIAEDIFSTVEKYLPRKRVFLVIDGIAPMMKYKEQLYRRYKNSMMNIYESLFDLNNITPGTKFLDYFAKYFDWYIKKKMNECEIFSDVEFFFSNEKCRGEGEYKAMKFLQLDENKNSKVLILSKDADWINLSLIINDMDIIICREEFIFISELKQTIFHLFSFENENENPLFFTDIYLIFLFLGNDYSPSLSFFNNFLMVYRQFLPIYKELRKQLTFYSNENKLQINLENTLLFLKHCHQCLPQQTDLTSESSFTTGLTYQKVDDYFYNLQNSLSMMMNKPFDWNFYYNFKDAPTFEEIQTYILQKKTIMYNREIKCEKKKLATEECLYRLFILLPFDSKYLLPSCLEHFDNYPEKVFYNVKEKKYTIETSGKNLEKYYSFYKEKKIFFTKEDVRRNMEGKLFYYKYHPSKSSTYLKSFYGNIKKNKVQMKRITIE